jgi:soluble lytic murein transglycosylase
MAIYREKWQAAVDASNVLLNTGRFGGSMTSSDEVKYLRGLALDKLGRSGPAAESFGSIQDSYQSYFSPLAFSRTKGNGETPRYPVNQADYPVMFRSELVASGKKFKVDPRFLLAIMKQESSFRAGAKSPAGARGLLQLVYDTAIKYKSKAGYPNLQPDQLYSPSVNIAIGAAYIADLKSQFRGLYEAIAASYNGGEDNAARWLDRSKPKEPGIFASAVGFAESKAYVFKVMNNYRIYRELYNEDLERR